jgi:hypothetical protein
MTRLFKLAAAVSAAAAVFGAQAATYSAADIASGAAAGATFAAHGGKLVVKNEWGVQGVGVSGGRTNDEIDIGEKITATFTQAVRVTGIQLAYLYDGPEFDDVQERAKITATFADLSTRTFDLVAKYQHSFSWTGLGDVMGPKSNIDKNGGFWSLTDPLGDSLIKSLSFTAVAGICGNGRCINQSDFALAGIATAPVPEPETYALMLAGLAGVGFMARRRKARS